MRWAQSKYGPYVLFVCAFIESLFSFISLSALFILVAFVAPKRSYRLALICALGAVAGAIAGYLIGHYAWLKGNGEFTSFALFFFNIIPRFTPETYLKIHEMYEKWGFIVIFTAGFVPAPFEVFVYTAGVFNVNFPLFVLAAFVSRFARYALIAFFIHRFGPQVRTFIERYFNWVALGIVLLVVIIFIVAMVFK